MTKDLMAGLRAVASGISEEMAAEAEFDFAEATRDGMMEDDASFTEQDFEFARAFCPWTVSNDVFPLQEIVDPNKVSGFCAGCGAHHVRAPGKMLCVECDLDFRDMG